MDSASPADLPFRAYRAGRFAEAAAQAERRLAVAPDDWRLLGLHAACRQALGDDAAAAASYRAALAVRGDVAKLHNGLGAACLRLGRLEEAAQALERAVALDPGLAAAHFNLGLIADNAGRPQAAADAYGRALAADSRHVEAMVALGGCLRRRRRYPEARRMLERALRLPPQHPLAWSRLLGMLERRGRRAQLERAVRRARLRLGDVALVRLYRGILADLAEAPDQARRLLESCSFDPRSLEGEHLEQRRQSRLARVCDRLGDAAGAMRRAASTNALARRSDGRAGVRPEMFLRAVARRHALADVLANASAGAIPAAAYAGRRPVFLVGFPRSGTTLLDSMLRGHPDIAVAEECDAVARLVTVLAGAGDEKLAALPGLSETVLNEARGAYFTALTAAAPESTTTPLVIDRFPLNLIYAGEIQRAFPGARFLLALRHPADCVLSCYLQSFAPSPANASLHSLDGAANLYDAVFGTWQRLREALALDVIEVRYEALIDAPEATCRGILEALGVAWHAGVLDHQATARNRMAVETASYDQVVRPLYADAVGRWRRYRDHLDPLWPRLAPWVARFGYDD